MLLEVLPLLAAVAVPLFVHASASTTFTSVMTFLSPTPEVHASLLEQDHIPNEDSFGILRPYTNPDPSASLGGGEPYVTEGALVATGPVGADQIATSRLTNGEINVYTVREGDSLSQIAEMYGVTSNTILWANNLPRATAIRPGDTLIILPIAGVQHRVVSGDTISAIAKRYDGDVDEILAYNQLSGSSDLVVGQTVVVPGGQIQAAPAPAARVAHAAQPTRTSGSVSVSGGLSHPLPGSVRTQGLHGFNAVDFGAPVGTPIRAAAAGEVIVSRNSGWNGGYGNYIVIRHPNGVQTLYAHNSQNTVGVGEYVRAGQTIGLVGNTGRSTGPHLHFEVRGGTNPF